jgi:soluble lytic murein transglycosylase-like protein
MNYSVVALALGYATAIAPLTLTPVPTRHYTQPLRSIATVVVRSVPTPSPSLSPLPFNLVQRYARAGARASGLDEALVLAVIESESAGDPHAVSTAGAVGMMQLMRSTAYDCGIRSRWVPSANVRCGSRTLASLIRRFGLTVATIHRAGTSHLSPWPSETKTYVRVVVQRYDRIQHI